MPEDNDLWSLEQEIKFLDLRLSQQEQRLGRVEASVIFRFNRRVGGILGSLKKTAGQLLLHSPFHRYYVRLKGPDKAPPPRDPYAEWLAGQQAPLPSLLWHQQEEARWTFQPVVTVLMSTYRPKKEWLERAIASVKAQSYEKWQLSVCDDASEEPWVREYLESQSRADPRIRVAFRESNGGISAAFNTAGQLATGDYVTFLDHDDELDPYALHYLVEACQQGGVDVLYSDEDCLNPSGERCMPGFKPDWSPELLDSRMYFGHLLAATRRLIDEVGWFSSDCDGAQDYDLVLRLVERAHKIVHIRRILYHWRQHPQSTAMDPKSKPYAQEAGRLALARAVSRRRIDATVEDAPLPFAYYLHRSTAHPPVSLVVLTRDARLLSIFLEGRKITRYPAVELVVVEHAHPGGQELSRLLDATDCVRVRYEGPFNFSRMSNLGAQGAGAGLLVFLNDDVTPLRPDWLEVMAAHLERPEIGVVGGRLLYPSGAMQHAGVVLGMGGGAGHPGSGVFSADLMYYLQLPRDVSAVTGACLGIRKDLFQELGGFDESFPVNYNDVDLCLRVREHGYRVLVDPRVELTHLESATRTGGTTFAERQHFRRRWGHLLRQPDPYYPEAFARDTEEVRLANPQVR